MTWAAKWDDATDSTVHVLPEADLTAHEETPDCACGPRPELVCTNPDTWVYVHHSLDGREGSE